MKRMVLAACLFVLGGCAAASKQAQFPRHYVLGESSAAATQTPPQTSVATLRVARVDVPEWLQGDGMHYRLAYRNDDAIATYANSDWAAPPADMLAQCLRNALAGSVWRAVVGPGSTAQADFTLHVGLDDFSQVFTTPAQSFGVLDATATLVAADGTVVAQRHFHFRVAAPGADAAGGVAALDAASRDFSAQLRDWLAAQRPNRS